MQDQGNGLQPLAFLSRQLKPIEQGYSAYEQELAAVAYCLQSWRRQGGQIIRNFRGPHPQCIADALHWVADEDQHIHGTARTSKGPKCGKCVKNADDAENMRTVQEKRASAAELSPVDPTDVICSLWARSGEIRSTGLLLATFNKVHILTY